MIVLEGRVSIEPVEPREQDTAVDIKVGETGIADMLRPLDGKVVRVTVEAFSSPKVCPGCGQVFYPWGPTMRHLKSNAAAWGKALQEEIKRTEG